MLLIPHVLAYKFETVYFTETFVFKGCGLYLNTRGLYFE